MDEEKTKRAAEARKKYGDNVEVRTSEVRAASDETGRVIEGYAAVFNEVTDIGPFKEVIDPAAFNGRLDDDVRLLFNHEGQPLARTTNNTLTLTTDETGLKYRAELADTTAGRDLYELIRLGNVSQSSFAFTIEEEERESSGVRRVKKVSRLFKYGDFDIEKIGKEDKANVKGFLGVNPSLEHRILGKNVAIIDDYAETGTTLREACDELLRCGAKSVSGYAILK